MAKQSKATPNATPATPTATAAGLLGQYHKARNTQLHNNAACSVTGQGPMAQGTLATAALAVAYALGHGLAVAQQLVLQSGGTGKGGAPINAVLACAFWGATGKALLMPVAHGYTVTLPGPNGQPGGIARIPGTVHPTVVRNLQAAGQPLPAGTVAYHYTQHPQWGLLTPKQQAQVATGRYINGSYPSKAAPLPAAKVA